MALPETSPGEIDPEASAALIAERAPDGLLIGSGLRSGEATRDLVALLARQPTGHPPCSTPRRSTRSQRHPNGGPQRPARPSSRHTRANLPAWTGPRFPTMTPRGSSGLVPRRHAGVASWSSRVPTRSSRHPMAAAPWPASRTRRWPPAARATSSREPSARSSPRAARRTRRRASRSTSTASPAEHVRERLGDAGLLAARPAVRDRARAQAPGGARSPRRQPAPAGVRATGDRRLKGRAAPVDAWLAGAGLPPLPRGAWLEIDLDALESNLADDPGAGRPRDPGRCRS